MILYWFLWGTLRLFFVLGLRVRVEGLEHVPRRGAFVLCSNHTSWVDPVLLGTLLPRQVFYMAKEEIFASPPAALVLRTLGAFPVRRHHADRGALRTALALLGGGRAVAVFPEGTRSRDGSLGRAQPGVALLAVVSGAEVLPVAICGEYRPGRLVVRFGPTFRLSDPGRARWTSRELRTLAEERIMGAVRALLRGRGGNRRVVPGPA